MLSAARACAESGRGAVIVAPDQRGYSPGARPAGRGHNRSSELALDVLEAQPVSRIGESLDNPLQRCVAHIALAMVHRVEVDDVNHAAEERVVAHDGTRGHRELLT
mgnify:CR=1 FL=1